MEKLENIEEKLEIKSHPVTIACNRVTKLTEIQLDGRTIKIIDFFRV
jgi:hypothetical protein